MAKNSLGQELATVVEYLVGAPAIVHQEYAGNCLDDGPTRRCVENGVDPYIGFDCSGLVVYGMAKVLGLDKDTWPESQRHVRDFWRTKLVGEIRARIWEKGLGAEPSVGSLAIWTRKIDGRAYPGHVGVIVGTSDGPEIEVIHTLQTKQIVVRQRTYLDSPHLLGILELVQY